ncbi:MAG: hypothetical protein HY318_10885 [Armatimonadetes bacterium]|nr:hypothetical protein [Armatimonadota bacterium]
MPQGSVVFLRKDKPGPLPLRFDWFARAKEPIAVEVSGPDGKLRLTRNLGEREDTGDASVESLSDEAATGLYRMQVSLPDYRYGLRAPLSDLPTVFVISAGSIARFFDPQIWYFRTAKDQTMVELNLVFVGREAGFHLRTANGRKSLASRARPGMLRAEVQPDTVYSLLTVQSGSNANMVIPVGRPLVLAMRPEHLFEVTER